MFDCCTTYSAHDPRMTFDSLSVHKNTPIRILPSLSLIFISLFNMLLKNSLPLVEVSDDVLLDILSGGFWCFVGSLPDKGFDSDVSVIVCI